MFIKSTHSITQTLILATYILSVTATAGPDQQSGKRHGPPLDALEACADRTEGAACSFSGRRGDVTGSCIVPRHNENELICAPEGGPPRGRHDD
jgi:hypothetical protein